MGEPKRQHSFLVPFQFVGLRSFGGGWHDATRRFLFERAFRRDTDQGERGAVGSIRMESSEKHTQLPGEIKKSDFSAVLR